MSEHYLAICSRVLSRRWFQHDRGTTGKHSKAYQVFEIAAAMVGPSVGLFAQSGYGLIPV